MHVKVHRNYSLELSTRIGCHSVISDIIVVIKVQTPKLVGGTEDHIMWDHSEYKRKKKYGHDNFLYYKKNAEQVIVVTVCSDNNIIIMLITYSV